MRRICCISWILAGLAQGLSTVVVLLHKPADVVTTHATDDILDRPNVYQQLQADPSLPDRLDAIGRLDAATTGLLLLTNDGGLIHHVTATSKIPKTYQAVIMGRYEESSPLLNQLRTEGIDIGSKHGGWVQPVPDLIVLDHPTPKSTLVSLSLTEGKNRQIRRMFHAGNSGVMKLHRCSIGSLTLDGVAEGEWRVLSDDEVREHLGWAPRKIEEGKKRRRRK